MRAFFILCEAAGVTCVQIRGTPLAEAAAAQQYARGGDTMGKIVLVVDAARSKER